MKTGMTVGDLRKAIERLDDDLPVWVEAKAFVESELDTLYVVALSGCFEKAGSGGFFSSPPIDHFSIHADGVPEGTCRHCGKVGGKHRSFCSEFESVVEEEDEDEDEDDEDVDA